MKILYGVPGEGMGHATRSRVVIEHLLNNHDVHVVSSSRAYKFLHNIFGERVTEINGFHLAYENSRVSKLKTLTSTLKTAPKNLIYNFKKYSGLKQSFHPDLVISDYESFTFLFAKTHSIPLLSIDNIQVLSRCELDIHIPREEKQNYLIAKKITDAKVPGAFNYLITSFFYPAVKKTPTTLVPPIIRKAIENAKPEKKDHILVYQTSSSQHNLVEILQQLQHEKFYVYGFNKSENHGNVTLKAFSETGFIEDLASAKAVIANGGFSLLSECVYLHKPVCSVPIQNQFEHFMNASYVEKEGFGRRFDEFRPDYIKAFLYDLQAFEQNLKRYQQDGNKKLFEELDKILKEVVSR